MPRRIPESTAPWGAPWIQDTVGDGSKSDSGFDALSGAPERGEDSLYPFTDDAVSGNTCGQRLGVTLCRASPAGRPGHHCFCACR